MMFDLGGSEAIGALDREGAFFTHSLVDHPLLQMDEIGRLVKRMSPDRISFSAGKKPETANIGKAHLAYKSEHSLEYAIDNMDNADSYLFVDGPEADPEFRPIYDQLKVDLEGFCERNGYTLWDSRLFLFVSSPGAITPYHMDHQHTFLAQVSGSKTLYQWPAKNYELTTPEELEMFLATVSRKSNLKEQFEDLRKPYEMVPGEGVYIPFTAPHAVRNHDEISVSLSIVFNTACSQRMWNSYRMNYLLRNRLRLSPTLPGTSAWRDQLKNQSFRVLHRLGRMSGLNLTR